MSIERGLFGTPARLDFYSGAPEDIARIFTRRRENAT
jgi:hypothetical protein